MFLSFSHNTNKMECDICCHAYSEEVIPKILSACGHTICCKCIATLRANGPAGPFVVCPHCRKSTHPSEIRTNYVVSDLARAKVALEMSKKTDTVCKFHPKNPVCVLCVTCGVFVCSACFETNDTSHASHVRVSIDEGLKRVQQDKSRIREHLSRIAETVKCKILVESSSVEQANQKLRLMALTAVEHYTATVSKMKTELDAVLNQLTNFQTFIGQDLQFHLLKQSHIQKLLNELSDSEDIVSAELFLQSRVHINADLLHLVEEGSVTESLEDLRINSPRNSEPEPSKLQLLPELVLKDSKHFSMFELLFPLDKAGLDSPRLRVARSIHRSTSNDNLTK